MAQPLADTPARDASQPRRPLPALAAAMAAGSLAGAAAPVSAAAWSFALAACAGVWIGARSSCACRAVVALRVAPIAIACCAALLARTSAPPRALAADPTGFEGRWHGFASGAGRIRGAVEADDGSQLDAELAAGSVGPSERIRVSPTATPTRRASGPVEPSCVPGAPPPPRVFELHVDEVERTDLAPSWLWPHRALQRLRARVVARCYVLRNGAARDIARALLAGDTSEIDPELSDLFTRTGLRHVLAVSGMHVAILVGALLLPIARALLALGPRATWFRVCASVAGALALAAFVEICGGDAPVRRAAVAIALAAAAPALVRMPARAACRADALSLWSAALIAEIACDPRAATRLSLQLSYGATLGLIAGSEPIARALAKLAPEPVELSGMPLPPWKTALRRARRWALRGLAASAAAALATLPLSWAAFGEWSPLGIVATAVTAPVFVFLLVYGWAFVAAPALVPAGVFEAGTSALLSTMEVFDALPGTPAPLPPRPVALLALATVATFVWLRRNARALELAACAAWAIALAPWRATASRVEVVALDVGHGTAVAVRAPGNEVWVFDAGTRDRRAVVGAALAPLLAAWETPRVRVVLSHDERDHSSALEWTLERYPVELWLGAFPARAAVRLPHSVPVYDLEKGALALRRGRGALEARLLRAAPLAGNEGSRVLELGCAVGRIVLCGDATGAGLQPLIEALAQGAPARLLLWPHHGADTPYAGALLDAVRPEEVWISSGPDPPVEPELERRGVRVRSTAREGALRRDIGEPP
jgi:competence protein ComEC